ncbi:MAG: DUF2219 family protein [Proteobacteria bacterium]|nr:DUF2219 family protein [Pseudomonadota bacterium]
MRALPGCMVCLAAVTAAVMAVPSLAAAQTADFSSSSPIAVAAPPQHWDEGVSTPSLVAVTLDPGAAGFNRSFAPGAGAPVAWTSSETWFEGRDGSVDRLRITQGGPVVGGLFAPILTDPSHLAVADQSYDVNYTRGWPSALKVDSGRYAMDVTPHAGVGTTSIGNSAELGATVRVGMSEGLERLGVQDGSAFGQRGRWYLYAETSGRAIGYNFLRGGDGGWRRSGLSTDQGAFIGDQQAGVAWRKGAMQASFGYVQRSIHLQNIRADDLDTHESMVALSFSFKPRR